MKLAAPRRDQLATSVSALSLASGLLMMALPAMAATTDQSNDNSTKVQEVVITAERRTTSAMKAPLAATVLTGAELEAKGVTTLDQLQFSTPAMSVSSTLQGNEFDIRGIGRGALDIQVPSGVQIYRDGVAVFPGFFQDEPYFDISDIQVLRGPQGTFAGLNATAGAVFITERDPSLTSGFGGYIQGQFGNYDDFGSQGAVNIPINDTTALRLAFNQETRDSFFHIYPQPGFSGNAGGLDEGSVRASLLWEPTSRLKVLFKVDASLIDNGGYPATPNPGTTYYANACPQERASIFNFCPNTHLEGQDEFARGVLDIDYTFPNGVDFRSISGLQYGRTTADIDLDGEGVDDVYYHSKATEPIMSQEFDLLSPNSGFFRWIAGAYFQRDVVHIPNGGFVEPGVNFYNYTTPKTNVAVFGQGSFELTNALELQIGLRFTDYHMSLHDTLTIAGVGTFTLPASGVGNLNESDSKLTGKVALNWTLNPDQFLYAFVATGHKSGSINSTNLPFGVLNPATVAPEDVTDFEVGWKATWLDGHARTQLGGFYNLYKNFQLDLINPSDGLGYIGNAGGTTIDDGVEAQAQASFGAWEFDFVGSLLSTRLGTYSAIDPLDPTLGVRNLTGNRLPFAPPLTYSVGAQYTFDLPQAKLIPRIDFSHSDSQWASVFEEHPPTYPFDMELAQRNILNAQVAYHRGPWTTTLYGTNLTNDLYLSGITNNLRYPGAPRQFGIRLERTF